MGRYRPPLPRSSPYITREGATRLKEELEHLWRRKRPEVTKALAAAAAEGDRSENAEYTYRKKQLGEIDRRVRYLRKRLEVLKVVESHPADADVVYFGAWVRLEAEDGQEQTYRIVGPDEFDADPRFISMDSPMARALMKRSVDDEVTVELPEGRASFLIVGVAYGPPQD
jgi:transcription elongation factor GreB